MTTTKATHTPSPWKVLRGVDDDPTRWIVVQGIYGQPEYHIVTIENGAPGDCLETEGANALLIAAAPDLLHALVTALLPLEDLLAFVDWGLAQSIKDKIQRAIEVGRAAIAKAEGAA